MILEFEYFYFEWNNILNTEISLSCKKILHTHCGESDSHLTEKHHGLPTNMALYRAG